jgi:hypothetical protein
LNEIILPDNLSPEGLENARHAKCYLHTIQACILAPIFLIPYFLRAIRLKKIFQHHKIYYLEKKSTNKYSFDKREKSLCIRELSLSMWFLFIMLILCAILVVNVSEGFAEDNYIPTHSLDDCMDLSI